MPKRTVDLTSRHTRFVDEQVSAGKFRSVSDVLSAGLRLLEREAREDAAKLSMLRSLAKEGFEQLDQGKGVHVEGDRELGTLIAQIGASAASRAKIRNRAH